MSWNDWKTWENVGIFWMGKCGEMWGNDEKTIRNVGEKGIPSKSRRVNYFVFPRFLTFSDKVQKITHFRKRQKTCWNCYFRYVFWRFLTFSDVSDSSRKSVRFWVFSPQSWSFLTSRVAIQNDQNRQKTIGIIRKLITLGKYLKTPENDQKHCFFDRKRSRKKG